MTISTLDSRLARALDLSLEAAFPPALSRLAQVLLDPIPDYSAVSDAIAADPAVACMVLHMANAPEHGFLLQTLDLQRAAVFLGVQEILKLIMGVGVQKRIRQQNSFDPEPRLLQWSECLRSAIAAEEFATLLVPEKAADAYVCALLSRLVFFSMPDTAPGDSAQQDAPSTRFAELLRYWGLANNLGGKEIAFATCWGPAQEDLFRQCIVLGSDWAALYRDGGNAGFVARETFEATLAVALSFSSSQVSALLDKCSLRFADCLGKLGLSALPADLAPCCALLGAMQDLYCLCQDLAPHDGGLSALVRRMRRHLLVYWACEEWELALKLPESSLYNFFQCPGPGKGLRQSGPSELTGIRWTTGWDCIPLAASGRYYGQLRLPAGVAVRIAADLPLYASFTSAVLDNFHTVAAVQSTQATTLQAMPVGVARLDGLGMFIDANAAFLDIFSLPAIPQRVLLAELFSSRFDIDIGEDWQSFIATGAQEANKLLVPLAPASGYPQGFILSLHKIKDRQAQFLLILENASRIPGVNTALGERVAFLDKLHTSMHEFIMTLDSKGNVNWVSNVQVKKLLKKNLFSVLKPTSSFFQAAWDESFLAGMHKTTMMEAQLQTTSFANPVYELSFTPLAFDQENAFVVVGRGLFSIKHADDMLRQQGYHDALTGLLTHSELYLALEREAGRTIRSSARMGVIYCDLDSFHMINDMYGHRTGDAILRRAAASITAVVRKGLDIVSRFGGDEFVIVLPNADKQLLEDTVERIQQTVSVNCHNVVEINCGLALFSGPEANSQRCLHIAEQACKVARSLPKRQAWGHR